MNTFKKLQSRLGGSRRTTTAMAVLLIAICLAPSLMAQIAPSGAVIGNQATATYVDANNVTRTAFSNLVQTTVTAVYKGTITPDNTKYATPGSQVIFPHVYTNTGNAPDSATLGTSTVSGSLSNVHIYADANGDGVPDNTTDISGTSLPVAPGAAIKFVVVATLNAGASAGSYTLRVTGVSAGGGVVTGTTSNYDTDTVTESNNGVINVTKSMSAAGVGGTSTVTLTYTNTGNNTATAVAIIDDLAAQGLNFTYVANSGKWNGTAFNDGSAPSGLTWTTAANVITATVGSVAPGVTGTITFNVLVGTPSSYPATFSNYAKYNYNDGSAVVPGASSYINTNTVTLAFNGTAAVKYTAGTATFTQGLPASGSPNTSPATSIIPSAQYNQGATITWTQTITNKGQVTDTYNLSLDTTGAGTGLDPTIPGANQFPSGTIFQIYRTDGRTPVTDSNGDGIVDAGPVAANGTVTVVLTATLPAGTTISSSTTYIVNLVATSTNATASNFTTPGLQDVIQDEVIISSTKNASVDVGANAGNTIGNGTGKTGESAGPYSGNPGTMIVIPFWVFNTGTNAAPDAYNLSFRYAGTSAVGDLTPPLTPFTGAQTGSVPPAVGTIPAWTVLIAPNTGSSCSTYGAPVTASSVIAASGNAEYCLLLQVPASYSANTYHFVIQAQSSGTGAIDQMAVQATVNTLHSVSITPNNQGTVYAGGTVVYKHVVTNGGNVTETTTSLLTPTLQATPDGWTVSVYADTNSNGVLDSGDASITTPYTIASLAPAASLTYFIVVQAPASANPGDQQVATWALSLASNSSTSISVTDTTTVVFGQLKLVKSQQSVAHTGASTCVTTPPGGWTTGSQTATSKDCVFYQIVATNTGTTSVTNPAISDSAPPYTAPYGSYNGGKPLFVNTCSLTDPAPAYGGNNQFTGSYTGSMTPGCTITVVFEVQLN